MEPPSKITCSASSQITGTLEIKNQLWLELEVDFLLFAFELLIQIALGDTLKVHVPCNC